VLEPLAAGLLLAQLTLLVRQRPRGRLVHDLVFGTVVVPSEARAPPPATGDRAMPLAIAIIGATVLVVFVMDHGDLHERADGLADLERPWTAVKALPEVADASVRDQILQSASSGAIVGRTLIVTAVLRRWPEDPGREAGRIEALVLKSYAPAAGQDLRIVLNYRFDLGFFTQAKSLSYDDPLGALRR
jgi:hypothetical protein